MVDLDTNLDPILKSMISTIMPQDCLYIPILNQIVITVEVMLIQLFIIFSNSWYPLLT